MRVKATDKFEKFGLHPKELGYIPKERNYF